MRTTRAYIASAGTASVLLGSALVMLVLVSTFVAFGSWPGTTSGKDLDQLLLNDVAKQKPAKVAVGADAVRADRRAQTRRVAVARAERAGPKGARGPASDEVAATTPSGTAAPTTAAGGGGPVAAAPGGSSPAGAVREQAKNVTQNLNQTTQNVGTQVGNTVDQTTQQVGQVVDQVVGGVQQQTQTTVQQVQDTTTGVVNTTTGAVNTTTDTVKSTTGSLLGH